MTKKVPLDSLAAVFLLMFLFLTENIAEIFFFEPAQSLIHQASSIPGTNEKRADKMKILNSFYIEFFFI